MSLRHHVHATAIAEPSAAAFIQKLINVLLQASTMYPVAFEVATSVKNGKTYKFRAMSQQSASDWVAAITKLVQDNGQTMEAMGDNVADEPAPPTAEELAAAEAAEEEARIKKEEERAARRERMAAKRKAAVEAQKSLEAGTRADGDAVTAELPSDSV
eukprot:SAG31_NODE_1141_length_9699_cov_4.487604_5_plen_158_part_00